MTLPLAGPALLGRFVDDVSAGASTGHLTRIALAYLVVALTAEGLQLLVTWASVHLAWRAGNHLRERLADHALGLDLAWHGEHSPGLLIERIDGDVDALTAFVANAVLHVIGNAILVVGVFSVALFIDWRAGLVIGIASTLALSVMVRMRVRAVPAHDAEREANAGLYGDLEERLGGIEDLRANGAGEYAVYRLQVHSARSWKAARHAAWKGDSAYAVAALTFGCGSVATLGAGIALHRAGVVSLGAVLALFRYSTMIRHPLERLAEQLRELQKALAGAARAARLLATAPAISEPAAADAEPLPAGGLPVDLDGVTLAYDHGRPALRGVDLHLPGGCRLGVIGRTGSGKTTLGRLLLRFWDPTEGTVRLGGVDLRNVALRDLRHRVAVVTQDVQLFRASLRDNLTLFGAVPASEARLLAVLDDVGLGPWVAALPEGLDTELEGTGGLSAGEAQLLAFARAFLADPGLVVLDEASSRLDPATEAKVAAATHRLLEGRTAVVIAHRLATLDEVDEIAVVDAGKIVEHGARADLAADSSSRFARLLAASAALADDPVGVG